MKVYVASSWRNDFYGTLVGMLRAAGHDVFDWRDPPASKPIPSWKHLVDDPARVTGPRQRELYEHPDAVQALAADLGAVADADVVIGLQPFGVSATVEVMEARRLGKHVALMLATTNFELMLGVLENRFTTPAELMRWLRGLKPPVPFVPEAKLREVASTLLDAEAYAKANRLVFSAV